MSSSGEKRHICLTGFMGSGKSTIGRKLAAHLQLPFMDTDDLIESREGMTVKAIFASKGEAYFRMQERAQIRRALASPAARVISLGGGALMDRPNRDAVRRNALLVYVYSRPEQIYHRIGDSAKRPLFRAENEVLTEQESIGRIRDLLGQRAAGYAAADILFDRDQLEADEAARRLCELIRADHPAFRITGGTR